MNISQCSFTESRYDILNTINEKILFFNNPTNNLQTKNILFIKFSFREAFTTSVYNPIPRTQTFYIRLPVTDNVEYKIRDLSNSDTSGKFNF